MRRGRDMGLWDVVAALRAAAGDQKDEFYAEIENTVLHRAADLLESMDLDLTSMSERDD